MGASQQILLSQKIAAGGNSVALDGTGTGFADTGGTTLTWNHTVGAGANRALFVGVGWMFGPATITSVTFNGVAMTQIWTVASTSITNKSVGFILANPDSGTHAIVVTFASAVAEVKSGGSMSFTGVNQGTPTGTVQTANAESGTNPSVTVGSVGSDDYVVDFLSAFIGTGNSIAPDANQTSQFESEDSSSNGQYFGLSTQPGSDGGVMSWTASGSSFYAYGAVALKPA